MYDSQDQEEQAVTKKPIHGLFHRVLGVYYLIAVMKKKTKMDRRSGFHGEVTANLEGSHGLGLDPSKAVILFLMLHAHLSTAFTFIRESWFVKAGEHEEFLDGQVAPQQISTP